MPETCNARESKANEFRWLWHRKDVLKELQMDRTRADDHEFFALDIWSKSDNLEAFYSDPNFQAGFAKLFDSAPSLSVYQSTDWHQW